MTLTNGQIDKYLVDSTRCPFCGSDQLEYQSFDMESNTVYQEIFCVDCENEWQDLYQHVGIAIREEDGWVDIPCKPLVWLVTVFYTDEHGRGGIWFREVTASKNEALTILSEWCEERWQDLAEPDEEGPLKKKEACPKEMVNRYFNFMNPEEHYEIIEMRLKTPA